MYLSAQITFLLLPNLLLIGAFLVVSGIQLYYYWHYFYPLSFKKSPPILNYEKGVSVVIAAKNESRNIENCINKLLGQEYRNFEIIVVNDYSDDDTLERLQKIASNKLLVLNNAGDRGKKSALNQGIKATKHEFLLFIDADCVPASEHWISNMVKHFSPKQEVVLGFGAFRKENGLLNKIIRLDGFITALQYFGFANSGKAYMGVGRNLAYRKSTFEAIGGFEQHKGILSGDDDLLVNQVATSTNVSIELDECAHTLTDGEKKWSAYFNQKRRQLSAGTQYKKLDKIRLAIFGASSFLFYFLFVTLLIFSPFKLAIFGIFAVKQLLELVLLRVIAKRLKVDDLLPFIVILEPIYMIYITAIGISTWFWKVEQWK